MGSERKSKEEKKIRKRSPTPESEAYDLVLKILYSELDSFISEKKSKDKHRDKNSKRDHHHSKLEFQELTKDDYFSKNNEFATWLIEEKKVFFSDLSSDSAREYFLDFIKAWNKQKLDSRYYEGISSGLRSAHNWKLK
ncbi:hypothetical protein EZV62_006204 [Acer yangbiense]|uniref:Uncharacterized protein n=1 Tax=Acer yangbiense TaxID=1000413 RepID=A0A5C7IQ91_9ROSI|nr:hypothetical protein EZV62_006204 [Acer yangbiense]